MKTSKITIKADPSKDFFIDMLTRDISLEACVLDLIDNSIDSIVQETGFDPMKGLFEKGEFLKEYEISIIFNEKKFSITDNAKGVTSEEAKDRIFHFGASEKDIKHISGKKGLSVYGIGMKRSFLKMGKKIVFKSSTKEEVVNVDMKVDSWLKQQGWELSGQVETKNNNETGTIILVEKLNDSTSFNFKNKAFQERLLNKINEVYGIFLLNGLSIKINEETAKPVLPKIAESENLKSAIETFEKNNIKVKIVAGVTHKDSKESNGWYIFCNGRLILGGDKTEVTGWSGRVGQLRQFHPSINRFVGFVYFESDDPSVLPWATTKDDVDFESEIYQYTLLEMIKMATPIARYLAKRYAEVKDKKEIDDLFADAKEVSIDSLKADNQSFSAPEIRDKKINSKKISYEVSEKDMAKIKDIIGKGNIPNREVGKITFYYYIDHEE